VLRKTIITSTFTQHFIIIFSILLSSCQSNTKFIGINKLEELQKKVPNMLARSTLEPGQWVETEVYSNIIPKGSIYTQMEYFFQIAISKNLSGKKHCKVINVSKENVTLKINGKNVVSPRTHLFSKESLLEAIGSTESSFETKIKILNIKKAEYLGKESLLVNGWPMKCHKLFTRITVVKTSATTGEDVEIPLYITYWLNESLPIMGIAKSICKYEIENRGEIITFETIETFVASGEE